MAIHRDLTPDFRESVARTALKALHAASAQETAGNGTVSVRNADGTTTVIGAGAGVDETGAPKGMDSFRGDTTPPGRPLGVAFSSVSGDATAYWDGRLDGGVPADFDRVEFYAKKGNATSLMGCLVEAGSLSMQFEAGDALDCWAVAFDVQGNESGESAHIALNVVDVPGQAQAAANEAKKMAEAASADISKQAEEVRRVDAKADAAKQAAAAAQSKAEATASDLDATKATVESHAGELGELSTKVSNAATKADSALTVSTEAKQTATEATTKAETAYNDSQTALTASTTATQTASKAQTTAESAAETANDSLKQSSQATQTANEVSAKLTTEYQTKADADKVYATQASLKATSESIASEVSKTYATKATVDALQNIADNAIESWRGSGAPTAENKPASDWTTVELKKQHNGDLYYDKATGKAYRWGSDDGVVYTWELNQDSDVTKALQDASKAQAAANEAGTAASKAKATADDASGKADAAKSAADTAKGAADSAASAASKAQGDVDKLKVDIPATYVTKSAFEQTSESITASVTKAQQTADSAATASTKAQQTADGISADLKKSYQTKAQADAVYATQASLKATSESLETSVAKAQGTADGAVTAASKAQQTADAVSLNLSKNYTSTADADKKFATKAEVTATSESITSSVSKTYATKDALSATDANVTKVKDAADAAASSASTALSTANSAKTAASTASSTASTAKSTADSALAKAGTAASDASTAKSTADAAKATADTAKSTADGVKTDLTNLKIGGTNLARGTAQLKDAEGYGWFNNGDNRPELVQIDGSWAIKVTKPANTSKNLPSAVLNNYVLLEWGKTYRYSAEIMVPIDFNGASSVPLHYWTGTSRTPDVVSPTTSSTSGISVTPDAIVYFKSNTWTRMSYTIKTPATKPSGAFDYPMLRCFLYGQNNGTITGYTTAYIRNLKVEEGTRSTDWSPSPLDYSTTVEMNSAIEQKAESITSTVSETYATKQQLSQVKQTADGLTTTVASVKSTADAASANASSALSKSTTLETLIRQSGNGIEVAKKVNGSYTSTKTLTDETGFSVLSSTGTVLSKFSDKKIELGKNSPDAVIELCNGYGVISATNGGVKLASKSISGGYNASVRTAVSGAMISATYGDGDHYAYVNADAGPNEGAVVIGGEKLYVNAPRKSDGTDQSSGISMVGFANMIVDSGWKTVWSDTNHTVRIRRVGCCVTLFIYADAGSFGVDWKKWTKVPDEFKPSFDVYAAVAAGANTGNNNVMLADVSADGYVYIKTMGGTCTGVRGQVTWFLDTDE